MMTKDEETLALADDAAVALSHLLNANRKLVEHVAKTLPETNLLTLAEIEAISMSLAMFDCNGVARARAASNALLKAHAIADSNARNSGEPEPSTVAAIELGFDRLKKIAGHLCACPTCQAESKTSPADPWVA